MKQVDIRKLTGGPPQSPRELIENMRLTLDAFEHAKAAFIQGLQGAPGQLNTTVEVILFQVPSLLKALEETLDERDKATTEFGAIALEILAEAERARSIHPPYNSHHEAYSILLEEVDEYWDEVKKKRSERDPAKLRTELIQVAAVSLCTVSDLCKEGGHAR